MIPRSRSLQFLIAFRFTCPQKGGIHASHKVFLPLLLVLPLYIALCSRRMQIKGPFFSPPSAPTLARKSFCGFRGVRLDAGAVSA
ncbi:hypothetical protein, partial [Infirmifilum sp.]|uniref:hypothetical protein n=1 Tax=Infirmifilum sp. TaxID=2856575 RepID=UPI003D0D400B